MIYSSMVRSLLIYVAETWSLFEDDRRRINTTEMDVLRRWARISKLDRKRKGILEKKRTRKIRYWMEITRKQLIWYGHVK